MVQQVADRPDTDQAASQTRQKWQSIVVAGMHRSGTSLLAKYFSRCGVDMGDEFLPANRDNPEGFFEDTSFVSLHESILAANGTNWTLEGACDQPLVDNRFRKPAIDIARRQRGSALWGWKDPRTVLFLEFWAELLPDAVFIFVYREPAKVIQSLYQRGDTIACRRSVKGIRVPQYFQALRLWGQYNRRILEFVDRHPERCILIDLEDSLASEVPLSDAVANKFGIRGLESVPVHDVLNQEIMSKRAGFGPWLATVLHGPSRKLYATLRRRRFRL